MRAFSGFTYQTFRANALRLHDRILPVTADVNWQPRPRVSLLARDQYSPSLGNQTAVFQADWGQKGDNRFLGVGFEHTLSSGSVYVASQEFAWKPSSGTWSAGGAIRSVLNSLGGLNFNTFAVFEKELWIKKDFHDFRSQILFRTRPGGVKEVVFNIQLRLDTERPVENL